ncbi:MAG: hypothetical protein JWQ38_2890 [Flavipsychrobacter sp.]|nr:hypothetical protein [Flavipsychrobacter sp.]
MLLAVFIMPYINYAQKIQSTTDSLTNKLTHANADTEKVNLLLELSKHTDCSDTLNKVKYATRAILLAQQVNWPKGKMKANNVLGNIYANCLLDYTKAQSYFEQYRTCAEHCGDLACQSEALSYLAEINSIMGHYGKSLDNYRKSYEAERDPEQRVIILARMGTIYNDIGYYEKAQECYSNALTILNRFIEQQKGTTLADTLMLDALLTKTGNIYTATNDYAQALIKYETALKINEDIGNTQLEIFALKNIGKVYELKKDYPKAKNYYEIALKKAEADKRVLVQAEIQNKLGNVYAATGQIPEALKYTQNALDILLQSDFKSCGSGLDADIQLSNTYMTLGKIQAILLKYNDAINYFKQAIAICMKTGSLNVKSEIWRELWLTYDKMKEYKKALDAHTQYIALRDSVYNIEKAKEITKNLMQDEFNEKQYTDSVARANEKRILNLNLQRQQILSYSGLGALVLLSALLFFIIRNYNQQKRTNTIIEAERKKSDELLLNILPKEVADELKTNGRAKAKEFDHVTVMFIDFVNFTIAAEKMPAQALVDELDTCFRAFDEVMTKYNIEKIKTVGDAYLAAAGVPTANATHGINSVKAAIEVMAYMDERKKTQGDAVFGLRVGIHSGSVVAGIVGAKKFAYDIWGDTVNTAARMEQNCEPGKIHISQTTYELVKDSFTCVYRGEINAKNKGLMKMYFIS